MKQCSLNLIKGVLLEAVTKAGFEVDADLLHIEKTRDPRFGDFSTNIAMLLSRKEGRRPREVADEIAGHLRSELIGKVEVADPGFINVWLEQKFYTSEAGKWLDDFDKYLKESFALSEKKQFSHSGR